MEIRVEYLAPGPSRQRRVHQVQPKCHAEPQVPRHALQQAILNELQRHAADRLLLEKSSEFGQQRAQRLQYLAG